jgi:uncharacterized protein HemY
MRSATPSQPANSRWLPKQRPDFAEAWLVLGTLQVQDNQYDAAEKSLKRYVDLVQEQHSREDARQRPGSSLSVAGPDCRKAKRFRWR